MDASFQELLESLKSPACGICRRVWGPASVFDDEEYDALGTMYEEAVAAFTESDGKPLQPTPKFQSEDVDRAECWRRGDQMLYVLLSLEDNTRICYLKIGLANRGTVVTGCWEEM